MALTDNLQAYWKLDESSGNAADSHSTNTLTNNNSTAFAAAKINNGADLEESSSQSLSIADASQTGLDLSGDLSFSLWFKAESFNAGSERPLIAKRVGAGNQRSFHFKLGSAGVNIGLLWYTDGNTIGGNLSVVWSPSTATWYHVVVTKSSTTVKFYVDGAQQGADQTGSNATIYNGTAPFELGAFADSPEYWDGLIDEVGVWSRALTDSEVSTLYNGGAGLSYPFSVASASFSIPTLLTLNVG